jgi:hypothetical protein
MSRATPPLRRFSTRLLTHETHGDPSSDAAVSAAFQICEKLRTPLTTLMGHGGFRALLSRALTLAKGEVSSFLAVHVNADGTLEASTASGAEPDSRQMADGCVALLAHLLGLLVSFIGANLTVSMVREVWPDISLNTSEFGK